MGGMFNYKTHATRMRRATGTRVGANEGQHRICMKPHVDAVAGAARQGAKLVGLNGPRVGLGTWMLWTGYWCDKKLLDDMREVRGDEALPT